ncbi:MAG: protein kinase [Candidatus Obscuribacterales bacterium]|nr:protein kinase [Candidatus Obscuribacterales bacterium]
MDPQSLIGKTFESKYQILSLAGMGGMGAVYKARQLDLERFVAIKLMHFHLFDDDKLRQRFQREAHALSELSNQHIAGIYSYGIWHDRYPYMVLEFLEGRSLQSLLQECEKLDWQRSLKIMLQVAEALDHAHEHGIIHRDLSPNNIMIQQEPASDFVKILDFGLAKIMAPSSNEIQKLTQTGTLLGSIKYMSPELCSGQKVSFQSDIYSFGCILYESLSGNPPHWADNPVGLMHKHIHEEILSLKQIKGLNIPDSLNAVVNKALQKDCLHRYKDMKTLIGDLNLLLSGAGEEKLSCKQDRQRPSKQVKGSKFAILVLAGALFTLLISSLFTSSGIQFCATLAIQNESDALRLFEKSLFFTDRLAAIAAQDRSRDLFEQSLRTLLMRNRSQAPLFCLHIAEYYASKNKEESVFWAWTGLKLLSRSPEEKIDAQLNKVCQKLCKISLNSKAKPTSSQLSSILNLRNGFENRFNLTEIRPFLELENYVLRQSNRPSEFFDNCMNLAECESSEGNPVPYFENSLQICKSFPIAIPKQLYIFSTYGIYLAKHQQESKASELLENCIKLCPDFSQIGITELLKMAELAAACNNRLLLKELISAAKDNIDSSRDLDSQLRTASVLMNLMMTTNETELSRDLLNDTLERAKLSDKGDAEAIDKIVFLYLLCHPEEDPRKTITSRLALYEAKGQNNRQNQELWQCRLAELYFKKADLNNGMAALEQIKDNKQDSSELLKQQKWKSYSAAASSLLKVEDFPKAETMARKALSNCSDQSQVIQSTCLLENTLTPQHRYEEALQLLESLNWLDQAERNLDPAILLMRLYSSKSDKEKADKLYQSLLNKKLKRADFNLVKRDYYMLCFAKRDYKTSDQLMTEQLQEARSSNSPDIEQELGWLWLKADECGYNNKPKDGLKIIDQAISLCEKTNKEKYRSNLGSWYYRKCAVLELFGQIKEAHKYFKKSIESNGSESEKLGILINAVTQKKLFDGLESYANYEKAILACLNRSPEQRKDVKLASLKALATCCQKQGKTAEEKRYLQKAKELEI